MEIRIPAGGYQDLFLSSESKFPALIAGVGTGKTLCLLVKVFRYCEEWPGTSALIVRREFTDLKDSTMVDFERYFGVKVGSDKNYKLPNGSLIMFRHADEIEVLKNINLGICAIEQAEEFDDDKQFQFLRDRLRQNNGASVHPLCIIANANGHNWCWRLWINGAEARTIDDNTAQYEYINGEYHCITASTFANEKNLVPDFVADQRRKATDAPNHYAQYVMNSFEQVEEDDFVFSFAELMEAKKRQFAPRTGYGSRVLGYDIARYGNDKCAGVGIQQMGPQQWTQYYADQWERKDLDYTTGRILRTSQDQRANLSIVDEDGIGSGPLDTLTKGRERGDFKGFRNKGYSYDDNKDYGNPRTAAAFKLKDMISRGHFAITDEATVQELSTLRYRYMSDGRKILVSKEEMRNKYKIASPNKADALIYAVTLTEDVQQEQERQYQTRFPQPAAEENLFAMAGVR